MALWGGSAFILIVSFLIFDAESYLTLLASILGVTSLILSAKGNPLGQLLMVLFSLLYGVISFSFRYYGEMITYLGMTMPMSVFALVSWLKNPYQENKAEVKVNSTSTVESLVMLIAAAAVTLAFYFILNYFHTANIIPSTISVMTSFIAVYLCLRRSPYFALAYAANDLVLVYLWILASLKDHAYISVVICFAIFFFNDIYGYLNWKKMAKQQRVG